MAKDNSILGDAYKAIVWQVFPCKVFSPLEISLQDILFWNHPYPHQKSSGWPFIIDPSAILSTLVTWTSQLKSIDTAGKKTSKLKNVPSLRVIQCEEQAKIQLRKSAKFYSRSLYLLPPNIQTSVKFCAFRRSHISTLASLQNSRRTFQRADKFSLTKSCPKLKSKSGKEGLLPYCLAGKWVLAGAF